MRYLRPFLPFDPAPGGHLPFRIKQARGSMYAGLLLSLALAACGGGGGGSASLAPTPPPPPPPAEPPPVPSPTPPPPPEPPGDDGFGGLTQDHTFLTSSAVQQVTVNDVGLPTAVSSHLSDYSGALEVRYNASERSYTLAIGQGGINQTITYLPIDQDPGTTPGEVAYQKGAGPEATRFTFLRPTGGATGLSYVTLGTWAMGGNEADSRSMAFFAFGFVTEPEDMPRTGTANYTATVAGHLADDVELNTLSGTAAITANFSSGAMTGSFDTTAVGARSGVSIEFDFTGTASIARGAATFSGPLTGTGGTYAQGMTGQWAGSFYGPGAAEIGGAFRLTGPGGFDAVGAFAGRR